MHDFLLFLLREPRLLALCLFNPLTSILHKNRHTSLPVSKHLHLCLARDEGCVGNEVCGYQGLGNRIFSPRERLTRSSFCLPHHAELELPLSENKKKQNTSALIMPLEPFREISSTYSICGFKKI